MLTIDGTLASMQATSLTVGGAAPLHMLLSNQLPLPPFQLSPTHAEARAVDIVASAAPVRTITVATRSSFTSRGVCMGISSAVG